MGSIDLPSSSGSSSCPSRVGSGSSSCPSRVGVFGSSCILCVILSQCCHSRRCPVIHNPFHPCGRPVLHPALQLDATYSSGCVGLFAPNPRHHCPPPAPPWPPCPPSQPRPWCSPSSIKLHLTPRTAPGASSLTHFQASTHPPCPPPCPPAAALVFTNKLALPENVLTTLLNDRLVAKGTVLDFITTFFQVRHQTCYMISDSMFPIV